MLAIDLCAGSGWAVAAQSLDISELGIEIMPEAIATRDAMGAYTLNRSIADLPDSFCSQAPIQIAGPPCQTFSPAGKGEGRQALTEVLRRVDVFARTREFIRGGSGDARTWLVLEPLRLAVHGLPTYIAWEQVPPVLPVWEACGTVLKSIGYSVVTGIVNSEQYGVPQTRKRAFLIARRDGITAAFPRPTHSRYYTRDPARLDPDVFPWVSMSEALGWADGVMGFPRRADTPSNTATGFVDIGGQAYRDRDFFPVNRPAPAVVDKARSWQRWEYVTSTMPNATRRRDDQPAPTIAFGNDANSARIIDPSSSRRVTVAEAAALQTFPADHPWRGSMTKQFLQIGNAVPPLLAQTILRSFL